MLGIWKKNSSPQRRFGSINIVRYSCLPVKSTSQGISVMKHLLEVFFPYYLPRPPRHRAPFHQKTSHITCPMPIENTQDLHATPRLQLASTSRGPTLLYLSIYLLRGKGAGWPASECLLRTCLFLEHLPLELLEPVKALLPLVGTATKVVGLAVPVATGIDAAPATPRPARGTSVSVTGLL